MARCLRLPADLADDMHKVLDDACSAAYLDLAHHHLYQLLLRADDAQTPALDVEEWFDATDQVLKAWGRRDPEEFFRLLQGVLCDQGIDLELHGALRAPSTLPAPPPSHSTAGNG